MGQRHTLVHQAAGWAEQTPEAPAVYGAEGSPFARLSWSEYWDQIRGFAKGIIALGHQPGEAVLISGNNRPEWVIAQLGTMAAGGIPAPVYQSSTPDQVEHIAANCAAKIAVCESGDILDKFLQLRADGRIQLDHVISMVNAGSLQEPVKPIEDLIRGGLADGDGEELQRRLDGLGPDDTGLFIYTSGTTGVPKGAELTNKGLVMIADSLEKDYPMLLEFHFRLVSYLPLSHIAEQIFTNFLHLRRGGEVYFCPDMTEVKDALLRARPTIFVGVPRVWEKFEAALRQKLGAATGIKAKLAQWARDTELAAYEADLKRGERREGRRRKLAHKLVLSKIHDALGLDQLVMATSGAAPISRATLDFFASIGVVIHEGYGMTETTGLLSATPFRKTRFGSVGKPLSGIDVRIADDGEIVAKGESMSKGYFKMPDKTAELIDEDGWLHTGDLGRIDEEGYLWITGRKKDLLITAGGKNVAPSEMEGHLATIPGVAQAVVVGDGKPYLCALIALDPEHLDVLKGESGATESGYEALAASPKVKAYIEQQMEKVCNERVARYQTIKKVDVLPRPFAVETGELTPSMKVKRKAVTEMYQDRVDALYA